jgi:hypothetical protein
VSIRSLLGVDGVSELDDLGGQASLTGVQDPAFGVREAGDVEREELLERALGLGEASLERLGRGPERRGRRRRRRRGAARVAEQRLPCRRVGRGLPGGEHGLGLPRPQPVAGDGLGQALLVAAGQARQRGRRRGGQPSGVDVRGDLGGQAPAERQAAIDPGAPAPEQFHDLRRREVILVGQRPHDPPLVHRAQRAPRRVGLQEPGLGHDAGGLFEHHRHRRGARAGPRGQALEAVDHLVGAVAPRHDAQGERGQPARGIGARAPERRQGRGELRDRHGSHAGHGCGASTGRSW